MTPTSGTMSFRIIRSPSTTRLQMQLYDPQVPLQSVTEMLSYRETVPYMSGRSQSTCRSVVALTLPSYSNWADPSASDLVSAFDELGIQSLPDNINNGVLLGHGLPSSTIDPTHETRSSAQTSFLNLAFDTSPLTVYTRTLAEKILFGATTTASGIQVNTAGMTYQILSLIHI